jgi:SOS response regulatory protein OraA/RecX
VGRAGALDLATRALARRDFSERGLRERLERAGVSVAEAEEALAMLRLDGVLDDRRFASNRAQTLAERGKGDAAIRFDLETQGLAGEQIEAAVAELEPERARAERIVSRRGSGPATARLLAGRGFDRDAIEAAVAPGTQAALG